jgi:hypothetical protein
MSQATIIYLAILTSVASLLMTIWKIWSDREARTERLSFEKSERAVRENHERNETQKREAYERAHAMEVRAEREMAQTLWQQFQTHERERRETFETSERTLRIRFMAQQERVNAEAEIRIKKEIESYVQLEKWREGTWQRNLSRLELASKDLTGTVSGLVSLIDEGPVYTDVRMIQETARVLDVFGDFQTSVSHFGMPVEMSDLSKEIIGHVTKILLTLSPNQQVRKSDERKALLVPLRAELKIMADRFLRKCGDFERDPSAFVGA